MNPSLSTPIPNPWPHRLAILLAWTTFPLIWVGGLVTTYDAGMAVPDWPGTYGYNLFLYPYSTWLAGPWDLFLEHGHRLLGALSGMLTIGVVLAVFQTDRRRWLQWYTVAALAAVIAQGCLGGARVLLDQRVLALIHGCAGPAFFAMVVALCGVTSRWWHEAWQASPSRYPGRLPGWAAMVAVVAYAQLVLGACLRHVPETATIGYFRLAVYAHLIGAGLLLVLIAMLGWRTLRGPLARTAVRWPASWLCLLLGLQLGLGCLTWIVNYLWPTFVVGTSLTTWYTLIEAKGLFPSLVMTAHQANGSLILGMSVLLALRLNVLVQSGRPATVPGAAAWGGATG